MTITPSNPLKPLALAIGQMIALSNSEMEEIMAHCSVRSYHKQELLSKANAVASEIFFIIKGIVRVKISDRAGVEHTLHFALENQFIADYTSFLLKREAACSLEALEDCQVAVLPRHIIDWSYENLRLGDRMGRLIAEHYFIYKDRRINDLLIKSAKARYDDITSVFPNIHNRVPQHMIASYLGITPIHLSRLKRSVVGVLRHAVQR